MKLKPSTKLLIVFLAMLGGGYFAWNAFAEYQVGNYKFEDINPGNINLIAVRPGSGYHIVVANSIAQLVEGDANFQNPDDSESSDNEGIHRRIPIRDMLKAMQGDTASLSHFVMSLNDMSENDLPPDYIDWKSEDIEKAFNGDAELKKRLEADLNVALDGRPLETINSVSLENGIVIDYPVTLKVKVGGAIRELTARILEPYRPGFAARVFDRYKEKPNITNELIKGSYLEEANLITSGQRKQEDVGRALLDRFSPAHVRRLVEAPEKVLSNIDVLVTDVHLESASYKTIENTNGQRTFDLFVNFNNDGRMRLWKYSRRSPAFQILLTINGIAVAAPRIGSELATNDLQISQLTNERLTKQVVDSINAIHKEGNKS